jgi:hypothetical protein
MIDGQNTLVTISSIVVTFFVPTIVWITLGTGLLQLVYTGVRRLGTILANSQRLAKSER